jgi:nitrous oxide reductase accessory protein NosL
MSHPAFALNRRATIALLAALPFVAACKPQKEGPEDVRWGREVCIICGMIISDPRFAAELRGGPERDLVKFDDVGDAIHWLRGQEWAQDPDIEFWVRDYETGTRWIDARTARYVTGVVSPMDYGFGAVERSGPDTMSFGEMEAEVLKIGLTSRCLPTEGQES